MKIYGRVLVSTESGHSDLHAEDGSWPRKNYLPKTSNANDNEVGNTGGSERFGQAMSLAEADVILAKFGYSEEDVVELAA